MKKLRKEKAPSHLQGLFYTPKIELDSLIESIQEWEVNFSSMRTRSYNGMRQFANGDSRIKCFKCGKLGHKEINCRMKGDFNNVVNEDQREKSIREEDIKLNGYRRYCIFDSGSSLNIITRRALNSIPHDKRLVVGTDKTVCLLNGDKLHIYSKIQLEVEFKGKRFYEWFYILGEGTIGVIIGNKFIEEIENKQNFKKKFPVTCRINTKGDEIISWHRNIRNWRDRKEFQDLVDKMLEEGKIEKSTSAWLNPVVLQRKSNGKLRFCCDYRKLNDLVQLDRFAIPRIEDIIRSLNNMRYFSIIDLQDGFFQVELEEKDREKTTFLDSYQRPMQFTVMPQGFKNSPAVFQRGMNIVLEGLIGKICHCYIDDIIIFGPNLKEHEDNFKIVKERLEEYNLKINSEKLVYCKEEVDFLGYKISHNKIRPILDRATGIKNFPIPTSKKKLRSFLGVINYDRGFIRDLSTILKPFYELLGEAKFRWTENHTERFNEIKQIWASNLELNIPECGIEFVLETDASEVGLGAVLRQRDKPISYISRVLTSAEQNYSTPEKEFLAIVWALEKFEFLISGEKLIIITDNEAISKIKNKNEPSSKRIARWLEKLSYFEHSIIHRPGKLNVQADTFSRMCLYVGKGNENPSTDRDKEELILEIHEQLSHRKTIHEEIKKQNINISKGELRRILDGCTVCKMNEKKNYSVKGFNFTYSPGERVAIDILEFKKGIRILTVIDYFSRKLYAKFIRRKTPTEVIKFLNEVFEEFKFKMLVSDNGKEFKNKYLDLWCEEKGIERKFCVPYFHEENGRIERANRTLRTALNKEEGRIKERLSKVLENYNKTIHRGIGMSPNMAIKAENRAKVIENQKIYSREFGERTEKEEFKIGDEVLVRNEVKSSKADKEFIEGGIITEYLGAGKFRLENKEGQEVLKHESQLKNKRGSVGYGDVSFDSKLGIKGKDSIIASQTKSDTVTELEI